MHYNEAMNHVELPITAAVPPPLFYPEEKRNQAGYYLQQIASCLATPLTAASASVHRIVSPLHPGEHDQGSTKEKEAALRVAHAVYALGAVIVGVPSGALSLAARLANAAILTQPYIRMNGAAPLKDPGAPFTLMTWNVCSIAGGFSLSTGGMEHWSRRIDSMIALINENDPDVLCLQEVQDTAFFNALFERLRDNYSVCYTFLGLHPIKAYSGVVVFSRITGSFDFYPFAEATGSASWENKGVARLIIADEMQLYFTHLQHGSALSDEVVRVRKSQLEQIIALMNTVDLPAILAGDMNINRTSREFRSSPLSSAFITPLPTAPTWTNFFRLRMWDGDPAPALIERTYDHVCVHLNPPLHERLELQAEILPAYDTSPHGENSSDHHAIFARITPAAL